MKILTKIFVLICLSFCLFIGSLAEEYTILESNSTTSYTSTTSTTCTPYTETTEICNWQCRDWDSYENGTAYCLGGYGDVCRNNTLTRETCTTTLNSGTIALWNGTEYRPREEFFGVHDGGFRDNTGLTYKLGQDGHYIEVYDLNDEYISSFGFGITGIVGVTDYLYTTLNFYMDLGIFY